ncbi:unnamed protein product [Schistosoma mattheei]|uniref:Uncharacterized protein n=1 Tax=Schistosoma mattheei TaxID=31246 RepID=A0A183PJQ7_9TREM|nr:unnamed protein product [Schistosoma mattheei]
MSQRMNLLVNLNLKKPKEILNATTTHSMRIPRCVMKWFKAVGKKAKCPQCNAKANRRDVRVLYCKNLKVSKNFPIYR